MPTLAGTSCRQWLCTSNCNSRSELLLQASSATDFSLLCRVPLTPQKVVGLCLDNPQFPSLFSFDVFLEYIWLFLRLTHSFHRNGKQEAIHGPPWPNAGRCHLRGRRSFVRVSIIYHSPLRCVFTDCRSAFGYGQGDVGGLITVGTFRARFPEMDAIGFMDSHTAIIQGM